MIRARFVAVTLGSFGVLAAAGPSSARASEARAETSRTVLLIVTGEEPVGTRLRAELRALGYDVVDVARGTAPLPDAEVDFSARSAQAVAVVAVGATRREVRVYTSAAGSEGLVLRATIVEDADPSVVALRAVEALRTSLGDIQLASPPPGAGAAAPFPRGNEHPAGQGGGSALRLGASIAPAVSLSAGETDPSWQALAVVHGLWGAHWGVEALGVIPLSGTRQMEAEGSARITYGIAAAGTRWQALTVGRHTGDAGIGIGAAFIHVEGTPGPGFIGRTTNTAVATPYLRIGYGWAVTSWLRVHADLAGFVAVPRPVLSFAGRDVGPWGEPLLSGAIGVELLSR